MSHERRRQPRIEVERPAKVRTREGKFHGAITLNVSGAGALVRVNVARGLKIGDTIAMGIAWGQSPLLSADRLELARVVRLVERGKGVQTVAVEYLAPTMERLPRWAPVAA